MRFHPSCLILVTFLLAAAFSRGADVPALQEGALPNGLRYAFLARSGEPGRISVRLIVHAGSLDEHDDELGYAHFVEHMAFNGTTHYPAGRLVPFFQRLGLAWGADANAETSFTFTTYRIDLPAGNAAHFAEALQVLADFAGGLRFDAAEVHRERGVIGSELRARDDDEWQRRLRNIAINYAGTKLPGRFPVGQPAAIEHAEPATLRGFYERCYRPERMTLLVVGDLASLPLEKLLLASFGALRGTGPAVPAMRPEMPPASPLSAALLISPLATAAKATVISVAPLTDDSPPAVRAHLGNAAVLLMMNRRLDARRAADTHIGEAGATLVQGVDNRFLHHVLDAHAAQDNWALAVALLEKELRRARGAGFSERERHEAASAILAQLRAEADSFSGLTAPTLANNIASVLAAGRLWHSPVEVLASAEEYFADFSSTEAADRLRATFSDEHLRLTLTARSAPEDGADAVLAAWNASAAEPLPADEGFTAPDLALRYTDFGPPGAIAARSAPAGTGIECVRFANGVRLNLRASTLEPHHFQLQARLGRGTADVPRDRPGINFLASALLARSDLGRHTREELRRLLGLHAVAARWSMSDNSFILQFSGPSEALPFTLQVLAAQLSDPKLEPARLPDALSLYPALLGGQLDSAGGYTSAEALWRASGDDPRFHLTPLNEVQAYSFEVLSTWLRTAWLEGPLEIGLAGDLDPAAVFVAGAATVGALPPRRDSVAQPAGRITFRDKPYRNLTRIDLPDHAATIRFFWPITDGADLRTRRALVVSAAALEEHLRLKLREDLGVTYAPTRALFLAPDQPDFGYVGVTVTFPPEQAQPLAEKTLELASRFAAKGLSKDQFARLREPLRSGSLADLRSNDWWLTYVLLWAQTRPDVLDEARTHATGFDALTREEVNRVLTAHVTRSAANVVGFIPQASPPPAKP